VCACPVFCQGETLSYGSPAFCSAEQQGLQQAGDAAFVLVAGGLGERLGYSGIKVALPTETATGACFLRVYCESILALQARCCVGPRAGRKLPLAIMTSGDTHDRTLALLEANDYFGASRSQITLLKQEKVVASWQSTHLFVHLSLLCRVAGRPCAMGCVSIHVPYCQLMHEAIKLHLASFALGCNNWSSRSQVAACMERVQSESHMHSLPPFPRLRAMFLYVSLLRLHPCPVLQTGRWRAWRTTMRGLP
jgi:UTP--glucose-1-phosphate uridylyltransferase